MSIGNAAFALLLLTSCVVGCATTAPASAPVSVTLTPGDVAACTLLGKVLVPDGPDAEKAARDETASLGGIVLLRKDDQVWNGNAYQ